MPASELREALVRDISDFSAGLPGVTLGGLLVAADAYAQAATREGQLAVLERAHTVMCPVLGADHESGKCPIARRLRKRIEGGG